MFELIGKFGVHNQLDLDDDDVRPAQHLLHCTPANCDALCTLLALAALDDYAADVSPTQHLLHCTAADCDVPWAPSEKTVITVVHYATITFMNMQMSADDALNEAYRQAPNVLPKLSQWIASSPAQADDIVAFINSVPWIVKIDKVQVGMKLALSRRNDLSDFKAGRNKAENT
ncbi:hypothetical protein C8F04DRAFT_1177884 [Mycena alexandri]|uniref:Uncharacterized protein n=1 Tax=Mycena alexandri TaxID=1745969 RepID=A0AAD6T7M4_9AGAR|nr:hypothetical protein C8F04DRAFT_1177884 [Mycena alexandri]